MALRLGMDPVVFLASEGMERTVREAVVHAAEKTRQAELKAIVEAVCRAPRL